MYEQMPMFEGDRGLDRLEKALAEHRQSMFSVTPMKLKARIYTPRIQDSSLNFLGKTATLKSANKRESATGNTAEMYQLRILASMLPDEIILHQEDNDPRQFEAAIMISDVSGFTDLSEKYNKMGKGGASMLSAVLNAYMGTMIQEILSQGGDVLKFSGDAYMAIFKVSANISMQDAVHKALDTALTIQKSCGQYLTDTDVVLKLKIAISAGNVSFSVIGTEQYSHYVLVGQPLWDAKFCESIAQSGEILVSNRAWVYINQAEYVFTYNNERQLYSLTGVSDSWRFVHSHHDERMLNLAEIEQYLDSREAGDMNYDMMEAAELLQLEHEQAEFFVRPSMNITTEKNIRPYLNKFMIPLLRNSIQMNEPVEYLNEMRQVVIVFINLVAEPIDDLQLIEVSNSTFKEIYRITQFYEGTLNKVSLFDKDMMFLVIFGLRGFKNDVQSQIALRCAAEIQKSLTNHKYIKTASVGVTTGDTYCGVVGHEMRREYSVISVTVNKAARLMMSYPAMVICDKKTYIKSNMSGTHFTVQPALELKGLKNVGPVYRFVEILLSQIEVKPIKRKYPLLGRNDHVSEFLKRLQQASQLSHSSSLQIPKDESQISLLIIGDTRQGKTCLLDEMFLHAYKEGFNCFKITTHVNQARNPYSLTFLYMNHILGLTENSTVQQREKVISEMLHDSDVQDYMFCLNPMLKVNFAAPYSNPEIEADIVKLRIDVFRTLCKIAITNFWMIFIDDIEFADEESVLLLNAVLSVYHIFFVITTGNKRKISAAAAKVLKQLHVKPIVLGSIDRIFQKTLACHFLNAGALDIDIERLIHLKSNGSPGWIYTFLSTFLQDGKILMKEMTVATAKMEGYVLGNVTNQERNNYFQKLHERLNKVDLTNTDALGFCNFTENGSYPSKDMANDNEIIQVAALAPGINIDEIDLEITEDVHILILYDSLSSYEQQIVKCSAVLGKTFLRSMLLHLLTGNERRIAIAIKHLFELRIFGCAGGNFLQGNVIHQKQTRSGDIEDINCVCKNLPIPASCQDLPRYASCGYIKIKSEHFMNASYDLLTNRQRKEYHVKAILYLENESRRCESCGNTYFGNLAFNESQLLDDCEIKITSDSLFEYGAVERVRLSLFPDDPFSTASIVQDSIKLRSKYESIITRTASEKLVECGLPSCADKVLVFQFGSFTYAKCECNMILYLIYSHLVRHAKGAGLQEKLVEIMMQQAGNCIDVKNFTRALSILEELEPIIITHYKEKNYGYYVYFMARLYIYQGESNFYLEQYSRARASLEEACKILRLKFPKSNKAYVSKACAIAKKTKKFLKKSSYGAKAAKVTLIYELVTLQIAECYESLYTIFKQSKEYNLCAITAAYSLHKAVRYSRNFAFILNCYANFILVGHHLGFSSKIEWMHIKSFELAVYALKQNVEQKLLKAISNLFYALMISLSPRSEKDMAINLGYMALQINKASGIITKQWKVVPNLVSLLNSQKRISDSLQLLSNFYTVMMNNNDLTGLTWYYALSMDILLDTSLTVASYNQCKQFYLEHIELLSWLPDNRAVARFYANMWLWCERTGTWDVGYIFYEKTKACFLLSKYDTSINILNALRVFEALILSLIKAVDTRDVEFIGSKEQEIRRLMALLEDGLIITKYHTARYLLLRTYFYQVINYKLENIFILKSVATQSLNTASFLVYEMVYHNFNVWCRSSDKEGEHFWNAHCYEDTPYTETEWMATGNKLYPYSLPLPKSGYY